MLTCLGVLLLEDCGSRPFCKIGCREIRETILENLVWFDRGKRFVVERAQVNAYLEGFSLSIIMGWVETPNLSADGTTFPA